MSLSLTDASRDDQVAALGPWFHNLHLPDGTETAPDHPLGDFPSFQWQQVARHLPEDLSGWTALDIGCTAGFSSFELAKRGAMVTGIAIDPAYLRPAQWAVQEYGLDDRVCFEKRPVYGFARGRRRFDLGLFMGVFYHLRYPLLALDTVARLKPRLMVFQTLTTGSDAVSPAAAADVDYATRERLEESGWPKMAFIERTFCKDPTNWWVPNHAAGVALLRSAGFKITAQPGHEIYFCESPTKTENNPPNR